MTLENCIKCKHHVSYQTGYVICNMYKHKEQHVINQTEGVILVVGCPRDDNKSK